MSLIAVYIDFLETIQCAGLRSAQVVHPRKVLAMCH